MNKKKKIIALVIVAIIGTLIFWKRDWLKRKMGLLNQAQATQASDNTALPSGPGIVYRECKLPPYKLGCKGDHIKVIQHKLNLKHKSGLKVDGYFGKNTEKALVNAGYGASLDKSEAKDLIR